MSVLSRPAILLASAAVAAGLLVAPAAAYAADTTTDLSASEMRTAVAAVAAATGTAAEQGWKSDLDLTVALGGRTATGRQSIVADPQHGLMGVSSALEDTPVASVFLDEGSGVYSSLPEDSRTEAALTMMGRPAATFAFTAAPTLTLKNDGPAPMDVVVTSVGAGKRTLHDDGSADLTFADPVMGAVTLHVDASSVLTAAESTLDEEDANLSVSVGYGYGPQTVTLPTADETVQAGTLAKAVAYVEMSGLVRDSAVTGAADTRKAAKGGKVKVATLRKLVRRDADRVNDSVNVDVVKVKNITAGVRVSATNPWTKKTVAYTVKASGKKVVVKKV
ncbi:hypothetical protein Aph02nite_42080 [Actinoplanes philippinensis]|uniref:Uncharacterized protein n=1 Tax=Actinoplanes philippinensis TaxID=35752 RepID=A0A1I2GYB2_9ACTN|nr:hypothetical protein [Actinoplanes philippinensis]GIE78258.1 hypothetical protein Aph02nite_42080 [Actinoplanes philippinensis]SFF22934.1 hypothetical protein SAMN05421541_107337 [Actinoplanes philippinensis]